MAERLAALLLLLGGMDHLAYSEECTLMMQIHAFYMMVTMDLAGERST
jgi:hypothetical protein